MNIKSQDTTSLLNSMNASLEGTSFQQALFKLWMNFEENIDTLMKSKSTLPVDDFEDLEDMDEIIVAQDQIANVACQSQADSFEGLLYKLALWRLDTPDFESAPVDADRRDRIVYSAYRDLVKITGLESVTKNVDRTTNFLGT